jgi:glycerophosphoryl diester phosphodiesterase
MVIIGHRGARGLAPENTLAAFEAGLQAKADELELDVRVTSDGVCVLHHNRFLSDTSGVKRTDMRINKRTLSELRAIKPDLATLDEAVTFVARRAPIIIEVKLGTPAAPVIAAIEDLFSKGYEAKDFLLTSFKSRLLRELHAALPSIECVINERFSGLRAAWRAHRIGATRVVFSHWNVWPGFIRSMTRRGFKVVVFTMNDPAEVMRYAEHGMWGVVTDRPDLFTHHVRTNKKAKAA